MMYKVIGDFIYTIIDDYICLEYIGLIEDKLFKHDMNCEKTEFKKFSGLGIHDILMNIMSCHGF